MFFARTLWLFVTENGAVNICHFLYMITILFFHSVQPKSLPMVDTLMSLSFKIAVLSSATCWIFNNLMHWGIGSWKTWLFFKLRPVNLRAAVLPSKPMCVYEHHIFGFNVEFILVHPFELCLPTLWMSTWYTAAISTKYLLSPCKSCRLTQDGSLFCPLLCQCSQPEKMGM